LITKLTITPCNLDDKGTVTGPKTGEAFTVSINPSTYTRNYEISYNDTSAIGNSANAPKFKRSAEKKIDFDILMDGTGVVSVLGDVESELKALRKVVYDLDGDKHQPNTVMLLWGSFKFYCKLSTMAVEYTLFKPSGEPLRAKIKLSFMQYMGPVEMAAQADLTSPDLTHSVDIQAGDTLPMLCYRIYRNSAYYLEVAKFNGITNFRNIKPGVRLSFPPLR